VRCEPLRGVAIEPIMVVGDAFNVWEDFWCGPVHVTHTVCEISKPQIFMDGLSRLVGLPT
jgi:hypothetical protein